MNRRGLFVTGTDTGVGKTVVTAGLAAALRRRLRDGSPPDEAGAPGRSGEAALPGQACGGERPADRGVRVWKPVQTGVRPGAPEADSWRLRTGGGLDQPETDVATLTFPEPLAPWMAARRAGTRIGYAALLDEGRRRLEQGGFLLVEGAGGLAVPLTEEKLIAHLARDLGLPLLIVARPGLGTVNHTLLTVAFARQMGIRIAGVVLNGSTEANGEAVRENIEMIETFGTVPVLGALPRLDEPAGEDEVGWTSWRNRWTEVVEASLDWSRLLVE